jgi:hypothetical protein
MAYRVTVDHDRPLTELIAEGAFAYANPQITESRFPATRSGRETITVDLVGFDGHLGLDEVQARLEADGWRPADLRELLALAADRPDLQREHPIIALGSVIRDDRGLHDAPYLYRSDDDRHLRLDAVDDRWSDEWRFAVVRAESG